MEERSVSLATYEGKTDQPEERSPEVKALVGGIHYQHLMLLFYCTEIQVLDSRHSDAG